MNRSCAALADREFVVRQFEHVLVLDLTQATLPDPPAGVNVRPIRRDDSKAIERYVAIQAAGFPSDYPEVAACGAARVAAKDVIAFLALVDEQIVAAGACEAQPPIGALFGAATREGFRRRGCQAG